MGRPGRPGGERPSMGDTMGEPALPSTLAGAGRGRTRTNARRAPGDMGPREAPMLRKIRDLYGFAIHATDGDIGSVHDFYFDDQHWTVRHLVVTTGRSLSCHRVLVDPMSVTNVDGTSEELHIALTKAQVANSPDVDTDKPVSRQRHAEVYWHYGFTGSVLPEEPRREEGDPHLRRTREVIGYFVYGVDDRIGHVDD